MIGRDKIEKKVTLDDIAAATNLSKFSVSRAIAGKSGISEQTRKVVLEACERLGYVKKGSPSGNEKKYVLFVIPKIDAKDTTFWMKVILGVESDLTLRGYSLHLKVTDQSENGVAERELDGAAGVIFAGHKSLEYIDMLQKYNRPNLVLTYPPYNLFPYDTMYFADREGAYALCERMLKMGHKRIAYLGSAERPSTKKRFAGVKEAISEYGVELIKVWDQSDSIESEQVYEDLKRMKEEGSLPTLIMCSSDAKAQSLIFTLNRLGLEVPKDISVTGYNSDLDETETIPLTSIGFRKREYGRLAVHYLMEKMENPWIPVRRISIIPQFSQGETARKI